MMTVLFGDDRYRTDLYAKRRGGIQVPCVCEKDET